jgi:hypothetical protein
MTFIEPFGSSDTVGEPNISTQKHFGATLKDFSVKADWSSQAGNLSLSVVESDTDGDKFAVPVINSPYFFEFNGFVYGGIVDSIHRKIGPNSGKIYSIEISSPNKILKNVQIVTDNYLGYGGSVEAVPSGLSYDGYYTLTDDVKTAIDGYAPNGVSTTNSETYLKYGTLAFGTNNNSSSIDWATNYNIQNVYGAYENDQYYQFSDLKGYGAAGNSNAGMRLDRLIVSLHQLVNHTTPSDGQKYLGGNILYGTDGYDITGSVNPYYYGFDAIGFYNQVAGSIPSDFRVPSNNGVISILDMVESVCTEINHEFMVVLNSGQIMSDEGGSDSVTIDQTYSDTIEGGWIGIKTFSKNATTNPQKPYSILSTNLLNLEIPDVGDWGSDNVNPGVQPVGYRDPMQDDYTYDGTEASQPYGGVFPVTESGDYQSVASGVLTKISDGSMSLQATDGTAYKFVVGGKQSRVCYVGRDYIYQYWGDVEFADTELAGTGIMEVDTRKVPVITPNLYDNDSNDFILIDTQSIFSSQDVCQTVRKGIYVASLLEIRAAMSSYESWINFLDTFKPEKKAGLRSYAYLKKSPGSFTTPLVPSLPSITGLISDDSKYEVFVESGKILDATQDPGYVKMGSHFISVGLTNNNRTRIKISKRTKDTETDQSIENKRVAEKFYDSILEQLHQSVKNIGDEHYGKSWCIAAPYTSTKIPEDSESIVGNVEKSWDMSQSAYLEPYAFNSLEAPKSNLFVSDGTISPYVNYSYKMESETGDSGIFSSFTLPSGGTYIYDFSEYDPSSMVHGSGLAHTVPSFVDTKYSYVPGEYFSNYDRSKIPFSRISDNSVWTATINSTPNVAGNNVNFTIPKNKTDTLVVTESGQWETDDLGVRMDVMASVIDDFSIVGSGSNDYGSNMIHMVKFKTNRVYYPTSDIENEDFDFPLTRRTNAVNAKRQGFNVPIPSGEKTMKTSLFNKLQKFEMFPAVVAPLGIGIPQISNRHRYGPWVTTFNKKFAGNVEFVTDDSLVPENHLIPLYGSLPSGVTFSLSESFSGTAGLNLAGQAIANSIDNFSLFADEQGTITIPGSPNITRIGEALNLDGIEIAPYITDMGVQITNNTITTTYNFRTYSPRANRTNRDIINRIQKVSNGIKNLYKGR